MYEFVGHDVNRLLEFRPAGTLCGQERPPLPELYLAPMAVSRVPLPGGAKGSPDLPLPFSTICS